MTTPTTRRRVPRLRAGTAALALVGIALLGACSSTGASTSTGTTGSTGATATSAAGSGTADGAAATAFDQCMSRNGVTRPTGGSGGGAGNGGTPPTGGAGSTPPSGAPQAGSGQAGAGQAPSAGQAPPGVDSATWTKALAACKSEAGAPPSQ